MKAQSMCKIFFAVGVLAVLPVALTSSGQSIRVTIVDACAQGGCRFSPGEWCDSEIPDGQPMFNYVDRP